MVDDEAYKVKCESGKILFARPSRSLWVAISQGTRVNCSILFVVTVTWCPWQLVNDPFMSYPPICEPQGNCGFMVGLLGIGSCCVVHAINVVMTPCYCEVWIIACCSIKKVCDDPDGEYFEVFASLAFNVWQSLMVSLRYDIIIWRGFVHYVLPLCFQNSSYLGE